VSLPRRSRQDKLLTALSESHELHWKIACQIGLLLAPPANMFDYQQCAMSVEFSVIIPTFRRPRELLEAVNSVLAQVEVTVEIIVVDDSPEGSAREVTGRLNDRRVTYLANPHPTGGIPSIVRNLGWPQAKGMFLHFLDDDDIVPEGHYAAVREAFFKHPEVGMIFGRIEPFGTCPPAQLQRELQYFANAGRRAAACQRFGPRWAFVGRMLFDDVLLICSASVLRRDCVIQLGGFDPEIRLMEDGDFHARAIRKFGTHFMDRVVLRYRIGSPSLMHSPNPSQSQLKYQREGHRRMQTKYRKERGLLEFYSLALFTRTLQIIDHL
jgi:glycosyltransferase involved in cell wall biosynthesis